MMAIQDKAFFEIPVAHEASHSENYDFREMSPEFEDELGHYGTPEAFHFSGPGQGEQETEAEEESSFLSGLLGSLLGGGEASDHEYEFEFEGESGHTSSSYYGMPATEREDESERFLAGLLGSLLNEGEGEFEHSWMGEGESDRFFGGIFKAVTQMAKQAIPMAKKLAPRVAGSLIGMIPGVGGVAGPLASHLLGGLLKETEAEVEAMENHMTSLFAGHDYVSEAEHPEAYQMALSELLAAEAATTTSEAEAEAYVGAVVPIVVNMMGKSKQLQRTLPVLAQANAQIAKKLRSEGGRSGRDLQRLIPGIDRRAVGMLNKAAQKGRRIDGQLANRAMATAAGRVLSDPRQVRRGIERNVGMRARVAPVASGRSTSYNGSRGGSSMSRQRTRSERGY